MEGLRHENSGRLPASGKTLIQEDLLSILGCPLEPDRPPLRLEQDHLVCTSCGAAFPIQDGIPDLLPESAIIITKSEEQP